MKTNPTETKKAVRFFAVTMAILLACSIMIWGFQTAWGQVKISRIYINSQDGTSVSSLIYVPKNATDETPAPVAVIFHGRSNHAHSNDTWSMEIRERPRFCTEGQAEPDRLLGRYGNCSADLRRYARQGQQCV